MTAKEGRSQLAPVDVRADEREVDVFGLVALAPIDFDFGELAVADDVVDYLAAFGGDVGDLDVEDAEVLQASGGGGAGKCAHLVDEQLDGGLGGDASFGAAHGGASGSVDVGDFLLVGIFDAGDAAASCL